jgi:integrase
MGLGQRRRTRFQDLRHTTASLLMQAGAPVHAVQRILRHRDPRMTTNVYGHLFGFSDPSYGEEGEGR